eukprot:6471866-Amphidinium_carterae.1
MLDSFRQNIKRVPAPVNPPFQRCLRSRFCYRATMNSGLGCSIHVAASMSLPVGTTSARMGATTSGS